MLSTLALLSFFTLLCHAFGLLSLLPPPLLALLFPLILLPLTLLLTSTHTPPRLPFLPSPSPPSTSVVVLGGSRGLGAATLGVLRHRHGVSRVFCVSRDPGAHSLGVTPVVCDLCDETEVGRAVGECFAVAGRERCPVAAVVVVGAAACWGPCETTPRALFDAVVAVNLVGPARVMQVCERYFEAQPRAGWRPKVVMVTCSESMGAPFAAAYACSKAGLEALAETSRRPLPFDLVTFHCGLMKTDLADAMGQLAASSAESIPEPYRELAAANTGATAALFSRAPGPQRAASVLARIAMAPSALLQKRYYATWELAAASMIMQWVPSALHPILTSLIAKGHEAEQAAHGRSK
jgi:NAD(P)-dependent dehydrogenase (short-subunit alcohol dehydrogenase family)